MDSTVWTVPRVRLSGHGLHVLAVKGIDPVVQLATLEELLTGVDTDAIFDHPRCGRDLAVRDGGERLVLTLTDELRDAVAAATPERLADVAGAWVQTEEFFGDGDPVLGAHFLRELSTLAKGARERGERLYCWVCT